ncbi:MULTISPECIES: hypothetical protein [Enterobacter cloacae complex]|nr:hypothetical protein [Enterobacter ludwigii]SAB63742.1 T7 tail fiber protein [Enterobacter ludwigii]
MATQPTQDAVPSESPRDLKFNAGKIDEFVTSLVNTYVDRLGNEHYTIEGLRWLAQQAIAQYGWILIDSFQIGADITLPNQALRDEDTGEYYRWDGALPKHVDAGSTPASAGGVGVGAWLGIGDASLRAMLAASTGAGMIGKEGGGSLQNFIDETETYTNRISAKNASDYYVGAFFNNQTDRKITLFKSYNGAWLEAINNTYMQTDEHWFLSPAQPALTDLTTVRGNDPDITFFNGKWHICITSGHPNPPIGGPRDLIVLVSDDLISWTPKEVLMGTTLLYGTSPAKFGGTKATIDQIWAPALFVDNNKDVWIVATVGINPNAPDIDGVMVTSTAAIGCKCNDLDALTFDPPQLLTNGTVIGSSTFCYDPQLHQDTDGSYLLACCNQYNKHIEIWRSSTVVGGYTRIADLNFGGRYVEAPCLMYSKKYQTWYLYADAFTTLGEYYFMETTDFVTWTGPGPVRSSEGIRHGTMQNLAMLPEGQQAIASFSRAAPLLGQFMPQSPLTSPRGQFSTAGTTTLTAPEAGMVYRVLNDAVRRFYLDDIGTTEHFYLACTSTSPAAGIVISGAVLSGGIHYIGFGVNNDKLVKVIFDKRNRTYFIEGDGERQPSTNTIAFNSIGNGWPTVTNTWVPQHGATYTIASAADNTVIAGINQPARDGMYFHVLITNDTSGQITFKSGGSGMAVGGTDRVFTGSANGNRVITVKKIGGAWRILV